MIVTVTTLGMPKVVPADGAERVTLKDRLLSSRVSLVIEMVTFLLVWPGVNTSILLTAV